MAPTASSTKHLFNQLSRKAGSSYSHSEEEFTTASSFDADRDAIHSTAQLPEDISPQFQLNKTYKAPLVNYLKNHKWNPETLNFDETDNTDMSMSIEQGRGVNKTSRDDTPPGVLPQLRDVQRKKDDVLKRQGSSRRSAADSVKPNGQAKPFTSMKGRALAEALRQIGADDESSFIAEDTAQHTATFNTRNTRFTRTKQASASEAALPKYKAAATESVNPARTTSALGQPAPREAGSNNLTVQSNSFVLPNLPNLNELVTGVNKDSTPIKTRNTSSGSRFTSASYKATHQEHHRVGKLAVPEEEKAIYASLQLLKSQSEHMEMELAEARKRNEEYEGEIIDLRSQLSVVHNRPDSALGSDDDVSDHDLWKEEKKNLEASVKALQDRHNRSERKISVTEIAAKRVTKERDQLMSELATAYCNNEDLKAENTAFKESQGFLQAENAELKEEVDALRKENQDLRLLMAQTEASYKHDALQREKAALKQKGMQGSMQVGKETSGIWQAKDSAEMDQEIPLRSRKEARGSSKDVPRASRPKSAGDDTMQDDLMMRIAEEMQKHRAESSAAKSQASLSKRASQEKITGGHSRSKSDTTTQQIPCVERKTSTTRRPVSAPMENTAPKRPSSAPIESNASDADSTTQLDFSQHARKLSREDSLPTMIRHPRPAMPKKDEDSRDLTLLSWQDPEEVLSMRKKLEGELRSGSLRSTRSESAGKTKTTASLPDLASLRNKAEEEEKLHKALAEKFAEAKSILLGSGEENATQQTAPKAPLKSNLKDIAIGDDDHSTRFTVGGQTYIFPKMVKSIDGDAGDTSILSNTSNTSNTSRRRRRSMASAETMTSEFIVPDITVNGGAVSMADIETMAARVNDNDKDVRSFTNVSIADSLTMAYMKEKNEREARDPSPVNVEGKAAAAEPVVVEPQAQALQPPTPPKAKSSRFRVPSPYVEYKDSDPAQVKSRYRVPTPHVEYQAPDPVNAAKPKYRVPTPHPLEAVLPVEETVKSPTPVSEREDLDDTTATIRPAQTPPVALATVIKQLQEEIRHLKINLAVQQRAYAKHDPSISKRRRVATKALMDKLTAEIEKRSDQVYALYDVLEGQKEAVAKAKKAGKEPVVMDEQQIEDTLSSLGINPEEFANNVTVERKSQQTSWRDGLL